MIGNVSKKSIKSKINSEKKNIAIMINKSQNIDFQQYQDYDSYSDDVDDNSTGQRFTGYNDDFSIDELQTHSIVEHLENFQLNKSTSACLTYLPPARDSNYDLQSINVPFLPRIDQMTNPSGSIFFVLSSPEYWDTRNIIYDKHHPLLYGWKNLNSENIDFGQSMQTYFHDGYNKLFNTIRVCPCLPPTIDKFKKFTGIRNEMPENFILFHYVGFGFPIFGDNCLSVLDKNTMQYVNYPVKTLFDAIKTPAIYIFDCSFAAAALNSLCKAQQFQETVNPNVKWDDWICLCATDIDEHLPSDYHLPKDFLTSCILDPIRTAILCHINQNYRTTLAADDQFPMKSLNLQYFDPKYPIHDQLLHHLTAIIEAIASESLPYEQYLKLFHSNTFISLLFQRFLLAQYLLHPYQVLPQSHPFLPDLSIHPLWQHWAVLLDSVIIGNLTSAPDTLFQNALISASNHMNKTNINYITPSLITLLLNAIDLPALRENSIKLLAKYASDSDSTRSTIAKLVSIDSLFKVLQCSTRTGKITPNFSNVGPFSHFSHSHSLLQNQGFTNYPPLEQQETENKVTNEPRKLFLSPEAFHSGCYLVLSLLQTDPNLISEIHRDTFSADFPNLIFEDSFPNQTKSLVAALVATLLQINERIRITAESEPFLISLKDCLQTASPTLAMWLLMIEKRVFDSYGIDLSIFFNNSMQIQAASFLMHPAFETRTAALAVLPYFLQNGQDLSNSQLFALAFPSFFDASYSVRFNFILFLSRFLIIYQEKITECSKIQVYHNAHSLVNDWISNWLSEHVEYSKINTDFNYYSRIVDNFTGREDCLNTEISIALFLIDYFAIDPHPSIASVANDLHSFIAHFTPSLPKSISTEAPANLSAPSSTPMIYPTGNFTARKQFSQSPEKNVFSQSDNSSSNLNSGTRTDDFSEDHSPIQETGGDAMLKVFSQQMVDFQNWEKLPEDNIDNSHFTSLATPPFTNYQVNINLKSEKEIKLGLKSRITKIAYSSTSLSVAASSEDGMVALFQDENIEPLSMKFDSSISSLKFLEGVYNPPIVVGTSDGSVFIWNPERKTPDLCFRADWPSIDANEQKSDMLLAVVPNRQQIVTTRGNNSTIKIWDLTTRKLVGEYQSSSTLQPSAIEIEPSSMNCYVGYENGLLVYMDLRLNDMGNSSNDPNSILNVNAPNKSKITKIRHTFCDSGQFYATTLLGPCVKWRCLDSFSPVIKMKQLIVDFDVHSYFPILAFSPKDSYPFFTDLNGKQIMNFRDNVGIAPGAVCAFHPSLPVFSANTSRGNLMQFKIQVQ